MRGFGFFQSDFFKLGVVCALKNIINMLNCLFCQIIQKKIPAHIVDEDEYCLAFLDINPASEGHTLIITKNHVENITKLEQNN